MNDYEMGERKKLMNEYYHEDNIEPFKNGLNQSKCFN
jgi:hypothetical protein